MWKKQKHNQNPYKENFKNKPVRNGFREYVLPENIIADMKFKVEVKPQGSPAQSFATEAIKNMWEKEIIRYLFPEQGTISSDNLDKILGRIWVMDFGHEKGCICIDCITKPNSKLNEDTSQNKV